MNIAYSFYGVPWIRGPMATLFGWPTPPFHWDSRIEALPAFRWETPATEPASQLKIQPTSEEKSIQENQPKYQNKQERVDYASMSQKAMRNAVSNIGNLLITFLSTRRRSEASVKRMFPELDQAQLEGYYSFTKQVKNSFRGYTTFGKLVDLWRASSDTEQGTLFTTITRRLSFYYVRELLPLSLITSKQIRKSLQPVYLSLRRKLMALLVEQNEH